MAKFQGDRLRDLGDPALKKKHHEHFISPPVLPTVTGGLKMLFHFINLPFEREQRDQLVFRPGNGSPSATNVVVVVVVVLVAINRF